MKTYIKFLIQTFLKSFFYVFLIILSLVFILNILSEIEFFREIEIEPLFPLYLSLLNSPSLIFEMFPFIFLISSQLFFINLFNDNQMQIFKYSGLKNSIIVRTISLLSFAIGLIIIFIFYNFSKNFKNFYLELKSKYSSDDKYLAVITKNGLWIKDKQKNGTVIINAAKIENQYLIDSSITQFDKNFQITKNIIADTVNITQKEWILFNAIVTELNNSSIKNKRIRFKTNFDLERISNLFSDLTSLTYFDLLALEEDYKAIGYSTSEINIQKHRFYSLPFLLSAMTIIAMIIMIYNKFKKKILLNLFIGILFSVLVYYLGNFSNLLGENGKLPLIFSVWLPVFMLLSLSFIGVIRLNEK